VLIGFSNVKRFVIFQLRANDPLAMKARSIFLLPLIVALAMAGEDPRLSLAFRFKPEQVPLLAPEMPTQSEDERVWSDHGWTAEQLEFQLQQERQGADVMAGPTTAVKQEHVPGSTQRPTARRTAAGDAARKRWEGCKANLEFQLQQERQRMHTAMGTDVMAGPTTAVKQEQEGETLRMSDSAEEQMPTVDGEGGDGGDEQEGEVPDNPQMPTVDGEGGDGEGGESDTSHITEISYSVVSFETLGQAEQLECELQQQEMLSELIAEQTAANSRTRQRRFRKKQAEERGHRVVGSGGSQLAALSQNQQRRRRRALQEARENWVATRAPGDAMPAELHRLPCKKSKGGCKGKGKGGFSNFSKGGCKGKGKGKGGFSNFSKGGCEEAELQQGRLQRSEEAELQQGPLQPSYDRWGYAWSSEQDRCSRGGFSSSAYGNASSSSGPGVAEMWIDV